MYFRRNEAFRYPFDTPLPGKFIVNDGQPTTGNLQIIDLSVNGMKVELPELDCKKGDQFVIHFTLLNEQLDVDGKIAWLKTIGKKKQAGLQLHTSEEMQRKIVEQLKVLAKQKNDSKP